MRITVAGCCNAFEVTWYFKRIEAYYDLSVNETQVPIIHLLTACIGYLYFSCPSRPKDTVTESSSLEV